MQVFNSSRSRGDAGSALLMALLVLLVLSLLGSVLLAVSSMETSVAYNGLWSEGAFNAAEAGVHRGLDQLSATPSTAIQAIPVTQIGDSYSFRSGRRTDTAPQPLQFVREQSQSGYSLETGTGYNTTGYTFYVYQINATGQGPLNAQREVEVQAEFGPASK
jgi:Tfp pilus assembly protein PilX